MKHPKPKKGNPHELVVHQHTFPLRSLQRFTDAEGFLYVRRRGAPKAFQLKPKHPMFCARRAWDQRAERGYMKSIEDDFQEVAEEVLAGLASLKGDHQIAATRFYALWRLRTERRSAPLADVQAKGITGDALTEDQQEALESNGYLFMLPGGVLPGRMLSGLQIQRGIDFYEHDLRGRPWGIARARAGEFLIPDQFGSMGVLPISPNVCLLNGWGDFTVLY